MRILPSILAHAATVQATILVGDYNDGSLMTSSFEEITFGSPIELFGTREFSKVFVNANAGAVSFDKEFVSIDQGSQTLQPVDPHKIVIGPYLADFASVTTYYDQTLSAASKTAVDTFVQSNTNYDTFTSTENLVVTWSSATGGTETPSASQLVLTTNGGLTFALFSYKASTPDFTTAEGDNGASAYAGILAHQSHDSLCLSTIDSATAGADDTYLMSLTSYLQCTDPASFTECGDYVNDYNNQYTWELQYKTSGAASSLGYQWDAVAECYDGFSVDSSGNKKFPAACKYDADGYYAAWETESNPRTDETFRCKQVESTFVQIQAVSISLVALESTVYAPLADIDMTKLPAIFQYLWLILLKNVVARNIGANLDLPSSMHIDGLSRRTRRSADIRSRPRRSLTAPTGADFDSLLDELSVWLDTSTFDDFDDVMTALTDIADSAGATGSDIDTINFTIGVDASGVTEAEVTQMVADAIAATADVTVDSSNVDTFVTDISAQISDELAQLTASSDCLGKGTIGGTPNANWVKPDGCCGAKPISSAIHGCCALSTTNSNGNLQYYMLDTSSCCGGAVVPLGDASCTASTATENVDIM